MPHDLFFDNFPFPIDPSELENPFYDYDDLEEILTNGI